MKRLHARPVAFIVFAVVAIMGVFLDRLTKTLAVAQLSDVSSMPFIPNFLDFQLVYNRGAAWGIFEGGQAVFLVAMAIVVIAILVYLAYCNKHIALQVIALGLITAGAIGNGIDRATSGEVVDFFHTLFIEFPNFNVADSCITIGAILFIVTILFGEMELRDKAAKAGDEVEEVGAEPITASDDLPVDVIATDNLPVDGVGDAEKADDVANERDTSKDA